MIFALTSCGPAFVPGQTKKTVSVSDVTGLWEYNDVYHKFKVWIRFSPSGTFTQTVPTMPSVVNRGTWILSGPTLTVTDVLLDVGTGTARTNEVHWFMIDDPRGSSDLKIFGGDSNIDDPDQWEDFVFIGK
jgi:hypothetical protein